jgi:hypothetical protein
LIPTALQLKSLIFVLKKKKKRKKERKKEKGKEKKVETATTT